VSFQAYIDNIKTKTGKTPDDFWREAKAAGLLKPGVKVTPIVNWLVKKYGLGRGHAMAIIAVFKSKGWSAQSVHKTGPGKKL
jgi:hypothetical protein